MLPADIDTDVQPPMRLPLGHFVVALGLLCVASLVGLLRGPAFFSLAAGLAHAHLVLVGWVCLTVVGALYQLVPMFAQSSLDTLDTRLRHLEEAVYPAGIVLLAVGRLTGVALLTRLGGPLVVLGLVAVAVVLARRLAEATVEWGPMLRRYAVLPVAIVGWAAWTLPVWFAHPLAPGAVVGAPGSFSLLVVGVIGFVVLGTLYHDVPFIVWVHRYSDRLGFESVPMIDDLYVTRLAHADLALLVVGATLLVLGDAVTLPAGLDRVGDALVASGIAVASVNLLRVVWRHAAAPVLTDRVDRPTEQ